MATTASQPHELVQPLQCASCHTSLAQQRYILHDNQPYCINCYETKFANTCAACTKLIATDSRDVGFKDKHWHDRCFVCKDCSAELIDKPFAYRDNNLYCAACYEKNPTMCNGCHKPFDIGSKKYLFQNQQWHEDCFKCSECNLHIGAAPFIPYDGQPFCTRCFELRFAHKCNRCTKVIDKGGLKYKGIPYHTDCFTCGNCTKKLVNEQFAVKEDKQYCIDCYGHLFAKKCTRCTKPITGLGNDGNKFVSFEGRNWHTNCFTCYNCEVSLVAKGFLTRGEDIFCPECDNAKSN